MKKDAKRYKQFHKIILFLLLAGIVIVVLNTRPESAGVVQERTVDQYSNMFFTYTAIRYPAKVEVLSPSQITENMTIGFNTGTDELDFSRVESGSSVKKQLNLTTKDGKTSKITVNSRGGIKPLLKFGKSDFLLNENDVVYVTMDSGGRVAGNYTGDVSVIIQRSNYEVLRQILGY